MNLYNIWNIKKQEINRNGKNLNPKIREIWWCNIGINIGNEIYGKGLGFLRPILIINDDVHNMFIGIPLTSKLYLNKYRKFIYTQDGKKHCLVLDQVRSFDRKRLVKKMYILSKNKYKKVFKNFNNLFIK